MSITGQHILVGIILKSNRPTRCRGSHQGRDKFLPPGLSSLGGQWRTEPANLTHRTGGGGMWGGQAEDTLEELVGRKGSCLDAQRRSLDDQGLEAERRGQS